MCNEVLKTQSKHDRGSGLELIAWYPFWVYNGDIIKLTFPTEIH